MERFGRVLRRVDRRLGVREPERSRILLELAGDLEDLYTAYLARGYGEEEARRRAEAWLAPDDGSLDGLRRLHAPTAAAFLSALSDVARSRLETAALTVLALAGVAAGLGLLWSTPLLGPPGPAAVAVLALGGLGLGVAGRRALRLFVSPHGGRAAEGSLRALPSLAAASVVVGVLGACLELGGALGAVGEGAPSAGGTAGGMVPWQAVGTAAGTAALGLVVAMVLALGWFWLVARLRSIRRARADLHAAAPWMEETA